MARSPRAARRARGYAVVIGAGLLAPVNTVLPAITGTAQEGQVLSVSTGTWTNSPVSYAYQWRRDGVAISGSINATRTLAAADVGHVITCTVTATNATASTGATTAATVSIAAAPVPVPVNTAAPVVSGTATVGQTLATTNGTWSNSPTSYTYAWRRDGVDIASATAANYTLVSADAGKSITCRVFATNAGGTAGATSNAVVLANALRVVANNNTHGSTAYVMTGSQNAFNYRDPHSLGGAVTEIVLLFANWTSAASSAGEVQNANPVTHSKVSLEIDGASASVPVTFGGARSVTIAGNQLVQSDPISAAALGFSGSIPRDTKLWVRGVGSLPVTGASLYCGVNVSSSGARCNTFDNVNGAGDGVDAVGALSATVTGQTQRPYSPGPIVLGRFTTKGVLSLLVGGDSIANSASDGTLTAFDYGYTARSSVDSGGINTIATLKLTKASDAAFGWIGNRTMRRQYFKYCNAALEELGVNDIGVGANANGQPATLYQNLQTIWADMRSEGIERIYRTNYLPRTTGAWTAADGSDQNQITWYDQTRDTMDTNFASALSGGLIDGIIDLRSMCALAGNDKKWAANNTGDGLHPLTVGHAAMAAPVRTAVQSKAVIN